MDGSSTIVRLLLATLAAGVVCSAVAASPAPDAKAAVLSAEATWVAAIEHRDVRTLSRLLADDFVDTSWQGRLRTRAEVLAALPGAVRNRNLLSDLSVAVHGDIAIVRGLNTVRTPAGAEGGRVRFTDVFVRQGGVWRAVGAQETLVRQ